jgi:1,4-dihydroxy-2-naphthoate octaprenyltransferase
MKNANQTSLASPSELKAYLLASRPRTWIASISPVLIGTVLAPNINFAVFVLTVSFGLFIQIGTNFANDYFDFIKGADLKRIGPKRATQEGWIKPPAMLRASLIFFLAALLVAIPLMISVGLWSFFLALSCIIFGILYTGGPKPLGYSGLGEALVFPFFGPIACCGAHFLQTHNLDFSVFIASLAPGFFSCAILTANNLRDEKTDRLANKWTLVAKFGTKFGQIEYAATVLAGSSIPFLFVFLFDKSYLFLLASCTLALSFLTIRKVFSFKNPIELVAVLQSSALLLFLYTVFFCIGSLCR